MRPSQLVLIQLFLLLYIYILRDPAREGPSTGDIKWKNPTRESSRDRSNVQPRARRMSVSKVPSSQEQTFWETIFVDRTHTFELLCEANLYPAILWLSIHPDEKIQKFALKILELSLEHYEAREHGKTVKPHFWTICLVEQGCIPILHQIKYCKYWE